MRAADASPGLASAAPSCFGPHSNETAGGSAAGPQREVRQSEAGAALAQGGGFPRQQCSPCRAVDRRSPPSCPGCRVDAWLSRLLCQSPAPRPRPWRAFVGVYMRDFRPGESCSFFNIHLHSSRITLLSTPAPHLHSRMQSTHNSSFSASSETLTSVTSTSPSSTLVKKPSLQKPQKDYFAALGSLQSQYGFGGGAPTPVTLPQPSKSSKPSSSPPAVAAPAKSSKTKDYEAAYAALCSSYGFGGAPVPSTNASWLGKK